MLLIYAVSTVVVFTEIIIPVSLTIYLIVNTIVKIIHFIFVQI